MFRHTLLTLAALAASVCSALAHDTWVQTNTSLVRIGDIVHVDFMLGNHGNEHRDFKLASKLSSLDGATVEVIAPDGSTKDLRPNLVDLGHDPKEGFYSAQHEASRPGLYTVVHTLDKLHKTTRAVKSAKAYFGVADSLDRPTAIAESTFAKPLGHPLEFVLETHPLVGTRPGAEISVRLLHKGQPSVGTVVSFVPRGAKLGAGFDPEYERKTDAKGRATFVPNGPGYILIVAHIAAPEETGDGYERTYYGATMVLHIPSRPLVAE